MNLKPYDSDRDEEIEWQTFREEAPAAAQQLAALRNQVQSSTLRGLLAQWADEILLLCGDDEQQEAA